MTTHTELNFAKFKCTKSSGVGQTVNLIWALLVSIYMVLCWFSGAATQFLTFASCYEMWLRKRHLCRLIKANLLLIFKDSWHFTSGQQRLRSDCVHARSLIWALAVCTCLDDSFFSWCRRKIKTCNWNVIIFKMSQQNFANHRGHFLVTFSTAVEN